MKTIYVSINEGNDSWTGEEPDANTHGTGPVKTLEKARDIAADTDNVGQQVKIIIREGIYSFSTPFQLKYENSGVHPDAPLTIEAYQNLINNTIDADSKAVSVDSATAGFSVIMEDGGVFLFGANNAAQISSCSCLENLDENITIQIVETGYGGDGYTYFKFSESSGLKPIKVQGSDSYTSILLNTGDIYVLGRWDDTSTPVSNPENCDIFYSIKNLYPTKKFKDISATKGFGRFSALDINDELTLIRIIDLLDTDIFGLATPISGVPAGLVKWDNDDYSIERTTFYNALNTNSNNTHSFIGRKFKKIFMGENDFIGILDNNKLWCSADIGFMDTAVTSRFYADSIDNFFLSYYSEEIKNEYSYDKIEDEFLDISTSQFFKAGITIGGVPAMWGNISLDGGDTSLLPTQYLLYGTKAKAVECGVNGVCWLMENGTVECFGSGVTEDMPSDISSNVEYRIKQISVGDENVIALSETGKVYVWGSATKFGHGLNGSIVTSITQAIDLEIQESIDPYLDTQKAEYEIEKVQFTAATALNPSSFTLLTSSLDSTTYNKLHQDAKGNVYVYNLGSGFDVGKFTSYWNGSWEDQEDQLTDTCNSYILPYSASQGYCHKGSDIPPLPEISVDDEPYSISRWPSKGYAEVKEVVEAGSYAGDGCDCIDANCTGKVPCYSTTTDICNYNRYTGSNSFLNGKTVNTPKRGTDGIFRYDTVYDSVINSLPSAASNDMYIVMATRYDWKCEGFKVLDINKTDRTIKINSHASNYGLVQFNADCYARANDNSMTSLCTCKDANNNETIKLSSQKKKSGATCTDTNIYMESNDDRVTRKWSTSNQPWRQDYWANPHPRRWYLMNTLEQLNSPGQYYIDRTNKKLYIWFKSPITSNTKIHISKTLGFGSDNKATAFESVRLNSIVKIVGADNIKFKNIHFTDTSGNGIDIQRSNNITIENCDVYNIRKTGIRIMGGSNNTIDNCRIHDTGKYGIFVGGGNKITLAKSNHKIKNCDITRTNKITLWSSGSSAIRAIGVGNIISKNMIYNTPSTAIDLYGNDNIIEYNNIKDVIQECDDCGAIYTWSNISNRGNVVRYNLFRNVKSNLRYSKKFPSVNATCYTGATGNDPNGETRRLEDGIHGTSCIYLDNYATGVTIYGNIFYKCGNAMGKDSMGTIFTNYGFEAVANNNIFIECEIPFGSNANKPYYDSWTQSQINAVQVPAWENVLNDKPGPWSSGLSQPGNFLGWGFLLNWNGTTLGDPNSPTFTQDSRMYEWNYREWGVMAPCDIRSTTYRNAYPNLLGEKQDNSPTSFLYFDNTLQLLKVNQNYPRRNYATYNIHVKPSKLPSGAPRLTQTYDPWNQKTNVWVTSNDTIINEIDDAGFVDLINGNFSLKPNSPIQILQNTGQFDPIPVNLIAGYIEETVQNLVTPTDLKNISIYTHRLDAISGTWGSATTDGSTLQAESRYLLENPNTKKYIMVYQKYYDITGQSIPNSGNEDVMVANFKQADLTKTVEQALIRAANEYNEYILRINDLSGAGIEHMGSVPLIVFDFETPIYSSILGWWTNKTTVDSRWGAGTHKFAIDFAKGMIPKAKELLQSITFRLQNNIPDIFLNAKFAHYSIPYSASDNTINGKSYQLASEDERFQRRKTLISDDYLGQIIPTQDFLVPPVYLYYPLQNGTNINPGICNTVLRTTNSNGRDWNQQQMFDGVEACMDWMRKTGIEKDIYPIISHCYLGDQLSYIYSNCNNMLFDITNLTKEFWAGRQLTNEDFVKTIELSYKSGKQRVAGFLMWSGYNYLLTTNLSSCNIIDRYKARAIYARDVDTNLLSKITDDSYWPTTPTCNDVFNITYVSKDNPNYIELRIITPTAMNGQTIDIYRKTTDTNSVYSKIKSVLVNSGLTVYTDVDSSLLSTKSYVYKATIAGTSTSTNEVQGKIINLEQDVYWKRGDDCADTTWVSNKLTSIAAMTDSALRTKYLNEVKEKRLYVRDYDRTIFVFIQMWNRLADSRYLTEALRMLEVALQGYKTQPNIILTNNITSNGSIDNINFEMRDACLHFAQLGYLVDDKDLMYKASKLLDSFADKIPNWPIWNPYNVAYSSRTSNNQNLATTYQSETSSGIWGDWIYYDLILSTPLLEAWALIRNESNLAATETKMKNLFNYFVNIHSLRAQSNYNQPDYSNMDGFQIRGKIDFGLLMPNPELLHDGIRQLKNLYKGRFFSDGWWNEPANAYHADLQRTLNWTSALIPTDYPYTDPIGFISVDGSRYDSFNIKTNLNTTASASVYAEDVVQKLKYPNNYPVAIGDTYDTYTLTTNSRNSNLPTRITPTPSVLFGTSCIGTLTNGTTGNETMVTMRYGANNVHAHKDKLNINVWCKGQEIISETTYQPLSGDTASSRGWHQSTPGHVTVTVNEMNQYNVGTYADLRRKKTDNPTLDAIPGMPDWQWRWNMSASNDYGSLRLFNTDFSKVKVMEVDAEKAYTAVVSGMSKYRRTISLVEIDNGDTYIVDIFRVTGGSTHDYMLHSCLQADHTVSINTVESSTTASGKLYPSGQSTGTPQETWGLDKPTKASSVTTSSGWNAIFTPTAPSENWKLHTYMLGSSGTQIIKLDAPAMRRIGNAPFVCVRRNGNQNVYIAVHHGTTKTQSSRITGIQSVSSTNSNVIAFKVTFDNGRTDTIISGETPTSSATIDDRISFTGSFGHLAENTAPDGSTPVNNQWAYLVDGSQFVVGDLSITGNVSHSGTITSINRMESGAIDNSFITNSSISSNFNNYTLLVDPTNLQRYAYTIDSIVGTSNSKVKITGEPGLSITGSTIKQEYFPNWGSTGTVQYRIPGSALMIKNTTTNQWDFTGTGSAVGVAPPTFTLKTAANSKQYFELTNITNPKSISSSSNSFACLVTQTGKVYCFGRNSSNQCTIPSNVGTIDKISCGYAHTLALRTDGTIVAWGSDSAKQGKTGTEAIQAQITAAGRTVTKISAGAEHNLALLDNGSVVAWGKNEAAQLSDPDTYWTSINQFGASWPGGYQTQASDTFKYYQDRSTRWTGSAGSEIRIYRCGYYGDNKRYTGCESPNVSTSLSHYLYSNVGGAAGNPVAPSTLVRIASYPTGWTPYTGAPYDYQFSRATTNDPTSVNYGGGGWTRNGLYSALGTSTKTYTDIAAGRSHNLLLASDGKIETWGDNYYYQITGTGPFLADNRTGFGIRTDDNTKYNYTNNSYSTVQQLKTTTNSVSKIATGYYTSMVLKPDNTIFYWARNDMDQSEMSNLTMPAGEIPTFINGAYEHGIVIGDKGTLKITGRWIDSPGYVINTLWVPSISATTYKWAGGSQNWSIAVTSTNKVILWGTNVATSTIPSYSITSR